MTAALLAAEQQPRSKNCENCSIARPRYYLFEKEAPHKLLAGPELDQKGPLRQPDRRNAPHRRASSSKSRPGRSLVSELPTERSRQDRRNRPARLVRAEGQPGALGHRNHRTEAGIRAGHRRTERHLRIHRQGPASLPGSHPPDRPARPGAGDRPAGSAEQAAALSGHFAVILDNEVQSRPIINFAENPDGIDGRTGRSDLRRLLREQGSKRRRNWRRRCRSARCRST